MKLYYGAYRLEGENILRITDDKNGFAGLTLGGCGTHGIIDIPPTATASRFIAKAAKILNVDSVEIYAEDFKQVEVR